MDFTFINFAHLFILNLITLIIPQSIFVGLTVYLAIRLAQKRDRDLRELEEFRKARAGKDSERRSHLHHES